MSVQTVLSGNGDIFQPSLETFFILFIYLFFIHVASPQVDELNMFLKSYMITFGTQYRPGCFSRRNIYSTIKTVSAT